MMMVRMLTSQKLDLNRCARCALPTDMREILMRGKVMVMMLKIIMMETTFIV